MALAAQRIAFGDQLIAVGFMTICTDNPGGVHLALDKGAIDIHLVTDLAVRVVERRRQRCQKMRIRQRPAVVIVS